MSKTVASMASPGVSGSPLPGGGAPQTGGALLEVGGRVDPPAVPPTAPASVGAPTPVATPRDDFPLLARPAPGATARDPKQWAAAARPLLDDRLAQVGAILLRGLPLASRTGFSEFFHALGYEPVPYTGAATRTEVAPGVFTPNLASPERPVMMHNDMAHMREMPAHVFLFCESAPPEGGGGETTLARNKDWHAALGPELVDRFVERRLERRMNCPSRAVDPESSRAWQTRYRTEDPREVESICAREGERVVWRPDGGMATHRVVPVLRDVGGEEVWFCSPQCTYPGAPVEFAYGDGEPIEPEVLEQIVATQWKVAVAFPWRRGDVLCIDNLSCLHGRLPHAEDAERRVLVALATPRPGNVYV